jgi:hypothetical protein
MQYVLTLAITNKPNTFEALLSLWDSPMTLSADLGVPYVTAQMMKRRKSVSAAHWDAIASKAVAKGVEITNEDLARISGIRRQMIDLTKPSNLFRQTEPPLSMSRAENIDPAILE